MRDEDMSENDRLFLSQAQKLGEKIERITELEAESKLLADNGLYQLSVIDRLEAEVARLREAHSDARSALRVACDWLMRIADKYDPQDTEQARSLIRTMRLAGALQEGSDD